MALTRGVAAVGVETESGVIVDLRLYDQSQRARRDRRRSDGSEEGATNSEPSVRRQDEQVPDLPKAGETQRSGNLHRDRKTDEPPVVFSNEHAEAARPEVFVQPTR